MRIIYSSLLRHKFLISILTLGVLSFLILFLAETYLTVAPRVSDILQSVAAALLTSGVVGFVFDYQTRKEFAALLASTIQDELLNFERRFLNKPDGAEMLHSFWESMMKDGLAIMIPEDETGVESTVRTADISGAIILYKGLIQGFGWQVDDPKINIEFVPKNKRYPDFRSFERNLVVIGAPGANPLSHTALDIFYRLQPDATEIRNGYVFSVDNSRPQKYLENLHIVSSGENNPAILEIKDGKVVNQFERYESKHVDGISTDSCLLVYGGISSREGRVIQVLVIAGHSRFSVIDGIEFVLSSEKWASRLAKLKGNTTATVLTTSKSITHGRVVNIAQPPHIIHF